MRMKQLTKRFLSLILAGTLLTGTMVSNVGQVTAVAKVTTAETTNEEVKSIRPLMKSYEVGDIKAVGGIKPYSDCYYGKNLNIKADLSKHLGLVNSLNFSNKTKFSKVPKGFDPKKVLEWGKYPGLNIDILQKYGFTGKGAVVAYVDQPVEVKKHEQYKSANVHCKNNSTDTNTLCGCSTLSLLVGKDIGIVPKAEVYYYGHDTWKVDYKTEAECLYQLIKDNKKLPKNKKITMVNASNAFQLDGKNIKELQKAIKACEKAGIMVWYEGDYWEADFLPNSDRNNFDNLVSEGSMGTKWVYVPSGGRTVANNEGDKSYIYWHKGNGTTQYLFGLSSIVKQIDPSLSQKKIKKLIAKTAYENTAGMKIVDPVELVCTVLDRVGKKSTAKKMRAEVKARQSYTYAVMNKELLSKKDIKSISKYLSSITDSSILVVDAAVYKDAKELYQALVNDHKERGGKVAGIQIFGNSQIVPAFEVSYSGKTDKEVVEGETVVTDYFYSNFLNDLEQLEKNNNVLDYFKDKKGTNWIPQWSVVRLPLEKGEFTKYLSTDKSIADGNSRATSFYKKQKAKAKKVAENSKKADDTTNYQSDLYKLICKDNYGVVKSNPVVPKMYKISNEITSTNKKNTNTNKNTNKNTNDTTKKDNVLTDGKPVSEVMPMEDYSTDINSKSEVQGVSCQELDNQHYRFTVNCIFDTNRRIFAFNPPNGDLYSEFVGNFDKGNQKIVFDIPKSILEKVDSITLNCKETSSSSDWIFLETAELK